MYAYSAEKTNFSNLFERSYTNTDCNKTEKLCTRIDMLIFVLNFETYSFFYYMCLYLNNKKIFTK